MCRCDAHMTDVPHTADPAGSLQKDVRQHVMPSAQWTSLIAAVGALHMGMEQEPREHIVLPTSCRDRQECGPFQKPQTCLSSCSKGQELPATVHQ